MLWQLKKERKELEEEIKRLTTPKESQPSPDELPMGLPGPYITAVLCNTPFTGWLGMPHSKNHYGESGKGHGTRQWGSNNCDRARVRRGKATEDSGSYWSNLPSSDQGKAISCSWRVKKSMIMVVNSQEHTLEICVIVEIRLIVDLAHMMLWGQRRRCHTHDHNYRIN